MLEASQGCLTGVSLGASARVPDSEVVTFSPAMSASPSTLPFTNARFEAAVKQEQARLRRVHPTPDDVPSCMTLFDDYLACNSA
jgi:hypothetical protein